MRHGRRIGLASAAVAAVLLVSGQLAGQSKQNGGPALAKTLKPVSAFDSITDLKARSVALFVEAGKVFLHPRCTNCHSASRLPRRGDRGTAHRPRVTGGRDGKGAGANKCANCHAPDVADKPDAPKAEKWALAPVGAGWRKKSLGHICRQVRNPKTNGGMDQAALAAHILTDGLIAWSWKPGGGRTPAPGTHDQFVDLVDAWLKTGAHCPD